MEIPNYDNNNSSSNGLQTTLPIYAKSYFPIVQLFDLLWCEPFKVARWEVLAHSPAVQIISIEIAGIFGKLVLIIICHVLVVCYAMKISNIADTPRVTFSTNWNMSTRVPVRYPSFLASRPMTDREM